MKLPIKDIFIAVVAIMLTHGTSLAGTTFSSESVGQWMKGRDLSTFESASSLSKAAEKGLLERAIDFRQYATKDLRKAAETAGADKRALSAYLNAKELNNLFTGAVVFVGNAKGDGPVSGYYNSYLDAVALVFWKNTGTDGSLVPVRISVLTGESFRTGNRTGGNARWLTSGQPSATALITQYQDFGAAFAQRFPFYSTSNAFLDTRTDNELETVLSRIRSASESIISARKLTGSGPVKALLKDLTRAMSRQDLKAMEELVPDGNILKSNDVTALPHEIKKGFQTVFAIKTDGSTLAFMQIIGNPRFVVPVEFASGSEASVASAGFYDIQVPLVK